MYNSVAESSSPCKKYTALQSEKYPTSKNTPNTITTSENMSHPAQNRSSPTAPIYKSNFPKGSLILALNIKPRSTKRADQNDSASTGAHHLHLLGINNGPVRCPSQEDEIDRADVAAAPRLPTTDARGRKFSQILLA